MGLSKVNVVDTDVYTAWCYPTKKLIHHQWHAYCKGDAFRDPMLKAIEAFEKYGCTKWLSDDRDFAGPLDLEDWKWGEVYFTNRIVARGWRYSAMVLPKEAFAQISTGALIDYFDAKGVEARLFTSLEEAEQWINRK